ncbi:MAG TPA: hypothetical protein VFN97_04145 [Actinospica sp.]|nr:hypothetical protein [Actinospica sp.]
MNTRTTARLVAGAAALGGLLCTAVPAHAALSAPVADAFMVSSSGIVTVAPTPHSNYPGPPTGLQTVSSIAVAPFASNSLLSANTTGDPTAGTSFAEAKADSLTVALGGLTSLVVGAVDTTCNGTPTGNSGNSTIASLAFKVGPITTPITLSNVPTTISIPGGLGSIQTFPSSTNPTTGVLTNAALKINLLNGTQTLTVAQASCGGAPPVSVNPTPMVSAPAAAGAGAAAIIGGVIMLRRRRKGASAGV